MVCESFASVNFDLRPLLQGQVGSSYNKGLISPLLLCPPPWGVDILFLLFPPSDVRRPMSGITHDFRSFKGKVLEPVILLHEKSGRTFCPKTRKTFRTFSENLGQNSYQSNFHSTGC